MASLTFLDNGRSVRVRVGETVTVRLPENASTGYRWSLGEQEGKAVELESTEPDYRAGAVGSGGEILFTLKARQKGKARIRLVEARSWEKGSEAKSFQVEIVVEG
ncbi:MAG: inhibitor of cysteine peptidase [Sphingomonadales bacterium]|jgi:inhibitor of cysteine peptidase|nr:inhibitor of cysteine peptidase [Sphingomonadales bacterium]MEA3050099.1 inhibitor of cysteine peptidase [Sphingomonadales bacterium]